mmetsp:Transcript_1380/g.3744  ORF Transcript_1380/g.3744 Transcript_1380/m.3744 type:complete len:772 (+) Transcript_1380:457-2772(+)
MVEHALLEGDYDELRVGEVRADHMADVLRVAQVQCGVDLIQNVHRRRLEEQQGEDQGERKQGALPTAELGQRLLPDAVECHLDLQALGRVHPLGGLELGAGVRQEGAEDGVEVLVDLHPRAPQGLGLLLVEVPNHPLNLALVVEDDVSLLQEVLVLLLGLLEHRHRLLVDVLAQGLLLAGQVVEPRLVVRVAVALEVKVCAGLAEEVLLLLNPSMLLLHPGHDDMGLLVVLLDLLHLVAEALLLQLLLLSLLPVRRQLRGEFAEKFLKVLEVPAQPLQPLAQLLVGSALCVQIGLQLIDLALHALVGLPRGLLTALLGNHLVAHDLKLNVGLLRLLALLLELVHMLLGCGLQLLDLLLEVADAVLSAGSQALDLLLQLLHRLLELLLLLRHGLDVLLELIQLRLRPLQSLLRRVVLAPVDPLLDELKLVLFALELALHAGVIRGRRLHALELRSHLVEGVAVLLNLVLGLRQLLQLHQDVTALGGRPARDGARWVVHVAVLRDRAHPDVGVEADLLGRLRRVADQMATEDIAHGVLNLLLEADDLERAMQLPAGRHDAPRLLDRGGGNGRVGDLVQRDDGHAPPQLPLLQQSLAGLLVVGDHEEEPAACADLQCAVVVGMVRADVEELGHNALHGPAVKALVGIRIVEVEATEVRAERVQTLLQPVQGDLALPSCLDQLLVALRVELHFLDLLPLLIDDLLRSSLLLKEALAVLLALRQGLLGGSDALPQARDAHRLLLLLGLHLRQPRLRTQELLAQGLPLALALWRRLR